MKLVFQSSKHFLGLQFIMFFLLYRYLAMIIFIIIITDL